MQDQNKTKVLIAGGLIGAVVGLIAAGMLLRADGEDGESNSLTAGKGVQIGMLVLGLLRQITSL